MTTMGIHIFGRFRITQGQQELTGFEARKMQELIGYLLLHRQQQSREAIASLLWPESSTGQAKRNLRQLLWQLQSTLLRAGCNQQIVVEADAEWLQIQINDPCWVDVDIFQQTWHQIQDTSGEALSPAQLTALQKSVYLYQGELLEGCYEPWCLFERERLHLLYLAMLEKLMACNIAHQRYEQGIQCGLRILKYDRARERTHRQLMRLYMLAGDRTAALRQYERCAAALSEELDVTPDERTEALYDQIKRNQLDHPPQPPALERPCAPIEPVEPHNRPLLELLQQRLQQLQLSQINLQRELQQTLRLLEQALESNGHAATEKPRLPLAEAEAEHRPARHRHRLLLPEAVPSHLAG